MVVSANERARNQMESVMAKGQKRGNREIRKPKATKPAPAVAVSGSIRPTKGFLAGTGTVQKKR